MTTVWFIIGLLLLVTTAWAVFDAFERTSLGCLWLDFFIQFPFIAVIVYVIMRYTSDRAIGQARLEREELFEPEFSRLPTEIEKARFIEAAEHGGTLFEADEPSQFAQGFLHFRDQEIEQLLKDARFAEAADNLALLYQVAQGEGDHRALDTYRHYIARIPGGMARVNRLIEEHAADSSSDRPPVVDIPKPDPTTRNYRKDIPF